MGEMIANQTPVSDRIASFWDALSGPHVRISVEMRRDHEDGSSHWDVCTFGEDVADAIVENTYLALAETKATNDLLVEALRCISQIQNAEYGSDWAEIEEARNVAFAALAEADHRNRPALTDREG